MTNADEHASADDLLRYAEGRLQGAALVQVEDHLEQCDACCRTVLLHREVRDLETLGLLPPGDAKLPEGLRPEKGASAPKQGISGAVGGFLFGLAGLTHELMQGPRTHAPGLARGDVDESVRNDPPDASSQSEHEHLGSDHDMGHGFTEAEKTFGESATNATSHEVLQGYKDTCAIQCQRLILNDFGVDVSEDDLVREATARHLYVKGEGTNVGDVGKLLEAHGLEVHRHLDANVFNLANELSQGHKVIVGLDAGELWNENSVFQSIADRLGYGAADHAVIVSGIDTRDPAHPSVIVTDPGTGDVAKEYPLPEFLDAWRTSHFAMISTADPVPNWHPEMVNFDYEAGHIPHIGHAPYELAHELHLATAHETDPDVMHRLQSVFSSVVSGQASLDHLLGGSFQHAGAGQYEALHHAVSNLMSLAHGGASPAEMAASLDTSAGHHHTVAGEDLGAASSHATEFPTHSPDDWAHTPADLHHDDAVTGDLSHPDSSQPDTQSDAPDPQDPFDPHHHN